MRSMPSSAYVVNDREVNVTLIIYNMSTEEDKSTTALVAEHLAENASHNGTKADDMPKDPLAIEDTAHNDDKEGVTSMDVGNGLVIKLDSLGPLVVNNDGVSGCRGARIRSNVQ